MVNKLEQLFAGAFDRFTLYPAVMQTDHTYIHQGLAFTYSANYSLTGTGGATPKKECYFITPAESKYIHFRPLIFSTTAAAVRVSLYEGGTYSGGSPLTPWNRNRNNQSSAQMQLYDGSPTVSVDGTRLLVSNIGSGGNPTTVSGGSGGGANEEIIFKLNTKYLIRCESLTTTATDVTSIFFWYEEGSGE